MKTKVKFYVLIYCLIFFISVLGLLVNIQNIALNDKIQKKSQELDALKEENALHKLELLQATSYANLYEYATSRLSMSRPSSVTLLPQ